MLAQARCHRIAEHQEALPWEVWSTALSDITRAIAIAAILYDEGVHVAHAEAMRLHHREGCLVVGDNVRLETAWDDGVRLAVLRRRVGGYRRCAHPEDGGLQSAMGGRFTQASLRIFILYGESLMKHSYYGV